MKPLQFLAKQLPHPLLLRLYHHERLRKETFLVSQIASQAGVPQLEQLDLSQLRKSDTLFVLGSAWSINDISDERWAVIAQHDSIGINLWPIHSFVPSFYHFESVALDVQPNLYRAFIQALEQKAEAYKNTIKILTEHKTGNQQILFGLSEDVKRNLYVGFSLPVVARNENELRRGIRYMQGLGAFAAQKKVSWFFKYGGSVTAMIALGVMMGYKRIVLCGVDLNRQDYFYHDKDRYPDWFDKDFVRRTDIHLTARSLPWLVPAQRAVYLLKEMILDPADIELFVESRESTLYPTVPLAPDQLFNTLAVRASSREETTLPKI